MVDLYALVIFVGIVMAIIVPPVLWAGFKAKNRIYKLGKTNYISARKREREFE